MTAIEALPLSLAQPSLVKMEERKRPSPYDQNESAPPLKKQATAPNGASKPHIDSDMPWKDDLEDNLTFLAAQRFQKDAIYRQMQEYKREKNSLEGQLKEMKKATRYHDDHLRIIDSWFKQLIDEVKSLVEADEDEDMEVSSLPSSLLFSDQEKFEEHLANRSRDIRAVITALYKRSRSFTPESVDLQRRMSKLLATEKEHAAELERCQLEKEDLESRLENASLRYMVAEKKIDRAKSTTVAKLEKQALLGGVKQSTEDGAVKREDSTTNGTTDNSEELAEMEKELNKTMAASEKQKEQLEKLQEENAKLTAQITELSVKSSTLTEDDYAKTELFKQFKTQHEDVIKRINDLEAKNIALKEENQKFLSERTIYQTQLESETRAALAEKESQLGVAEANLARIRSNRDELLAELSIKKATLEQDRDSFRKFQDLKLAQEERITALESENERLTNASRSSVVDGTSADDMDTQDLQSRFQELEKKYTMLNSELASMSTAFQKSSKLAGQKVGELSALEEKVVKLSAEKAKADQKFFAAMKSKETREGEIRTLRLQNTKSAEVVSQLKDAEAASRLLMANFEKQLAEIREAHVSKTSEHRAVQQQKATQDLEVQRLTGQLSELKQLLMQKDNKLSTALSLCRAAEVEGEELKSSLKDVRRNMELWKSKSGQSEQYEILRQFAYCNICKRALKNTVIKTCGHTFCNDCVEERLTSRSRKCPNCGKSFGSNDHMRITL